MSYFVHNSFICWEVNWGPLSIMITLGMPNQAIMFLFLMNLTIVLALMLTCPSTIVVVNMTASNIAKRITILGTR